MPGARAPNLDLKSSALNLHDLNLLQHYILHTSKNFSLNSRKSFIWERIIPEIAAKNVFLMHLLLAVSGLNLLTAQTPDKRTSLTLDSTELRTLVEHHQKGLQGLQERLASIEETNAEVLFAGSMLIVAFAFGSLRAQNLEFLAQPSQNTSPRDYTFPGHSSSFGKPHIQWLRLVRGVSSIARHSWKALKISRLRPLLLFSNSNEDWRLLGPGPLPTSVSPGCARSEKLSLFATGATRAILGLRIFWRTLKVARLDTDSLAPSPTSSTSPDINGDPERDEFFTSQEQAISVVEQMYQRIIYVLQLERIEPCSSTRDIQAELEDAAITSWPHLLPETFVSSLDSEGSPDIPTGLSFIILAHLYLLLTLLHELWYLGENFAVEIRKIHKLVADLGDPELFSLMEWPMNVVNSKSDGS
ncbi:hypothetical protein N7448_002051 [Penicillium atrosanguineum]|uniref:Uncharacterized protein n=1 Tax=Penicillium atrosanguineum TaxID=1132637 RepID=A0A9W9HCV9_9EURO|nr:uncharacterized protein N7443_005454 [Penicillium atrosanguineum]KAJ5128333.1 hypothetical protein N7526_006499 [Penicillium atrosanguineum]KAJ5144659.1 hypothetical protein N7448_002051 [Penicillium atrosanguineum]KAJ5300452.1 hypothetical protein N7443_005454 [Penicillium atrosanguineum]KAJ5311095.1 hypothetical protein N7476_006955 [Penicillium atrosanguineum]